MLDILNTPTSAAELDVEGDEDRHPDDEPETDQEFVRVLRGDDYEIDGETVQTWTWNGDPLMSAFDSAQDAMGAADDYHGEPLDWWQEEDDVWFAHRPYPYPPECLRDFDLDDNDCGTVAHV